MHDSPAHGFGLIPLSILLVAGLLLTPALASAQDAPPPELSPPLERNGIEGSINLAIPASVGAFDRNVDEAGYGLDIFFGYRPRDWPVVLGGHFEFLIYGEDTQERTLGGVDLDVVTRNSIVSLHAMARLKPWSWRVSPYIDVLFGFKYLETRTEVEDPLTGDSVGDGDVKSSDVTWSAGVGGGFAINIFESEGSEFGLDTGVRYRFGGKADYLREGSNKDRKHSRTDTITTYIGVRMEM